MKDATSLPALQHSGDITLRHDNLCLAAEDLLGKGRVRVTIEDAGYMELTLNGGRGRYPVLKFRNATKVLVLNKTNVYTLKTRLYGPNSEEWIGKDLFLEADLIRDQKGKPREAFGRTHGVRIVATVPPPKKGKADVDA